MFRIMQSLEEINDYPEAPESNPTKEADNDKVRRRTNPRKYLLYRPTFSQLNLFLSNALKEIDPDGVLFLYISADGLKIPLDSSGQIYGVKGGISLGSRTATLKESKIQAFYPEDLLPYTRRNFFLVIDSDNSFAFKNLPNVFGCSLLCLLSPQCYPSELRDASVTGNLFTAFLYAPLVTFCTVVNMSEITNELFENCSKVLQNGFDDIQKLLLSTNEIVSSISKFLDDDFLRQFIIRFIFCHAVFSQHIIFQTKAEYLPICSPELPKQILYHTIVLSLVQKLAGMIGSKTLSLFKFAESLQLENI